jgi:2-keto-3-deoxy-L-rhamnonate aldolase RhmA
VRVPWNDPIRIKPILDLGAGGVLVPQVASAQEATTAVAACKYPPIGIRGFGPRRASDYGRNMKEYVEKANEATFVGIQIEHVLGVENIGEIVQVPGIDAVLLGPMDLSASMNLLGQLDHPEVVAAMDAVVAAAIGAGLPVGIPLPMDAPVEVVQHWVAKGCRFTVSGGDQGLLEHAARTSLVNLRHSLK